MRSTFRPLARAFFNRSPTEVAPGLLGKLLIRRLAEGGELRARIVETEAYLGEHDPAAHAYAGLTPRTAILFGPPGRAYIYLIYGLHLCLNVSTLPNGQPGGVLFRAAALVGASPVPLTGPGRLTRALAITASLNGSDLTHPGPLYLAADGHPSAAIAVTARVGIRKAADLPYRYFLDGHPAVSAPRGPVLARLSPTHNAPSRLRPSPRQRYTPA